MRWCESENGDAKIIRRLRERANRNDDNENGNRHSDRSAEKEKWICVMYCMSVHDSRWSLGAGEEQGIWRRGKEQKSAARKTFKGHSGILYRAYPNALYLRYIVRIFGVLNYYRRTTFSGWKYRRYLTQANCSHTHPHTHPPTRSHTRTASLCCSPSHTHSRTIYIRISMVAKRKYIVLYAVYHIYWFSSLVFSCVRLFVRCVSAVRGPLNLIGPGSLLCCSHVQWKCDTR